MSDSKWLRTQCPAPLELDVLPICLGEFLQAKKAILDEAERRRKIFASFNLENALEACKLLYKKECSDLPKDLSSLLLNPDFTYDADNFSAAVKGMTCFGTSVLEWFQTEQTYSRTEQLITWLMNSGDAIRRYAKVLLTPCSTSNTPVTEVLRASSRSWVMLDSKLKNIVVTDWSMVAG